jgi:hypothetical protein
MCKCALVLFSLIGAIGSFFALIASIYGAVILTVYDRNANECCSDDDARPTCLYCYGSWIFEYTNVLWPEVQHAVEHGIRADCDNTHGTAIITFKVFESSDTAEQR